jgi:two-component system, NarL family, sensor histidine kinase UhpB
MGRSLSLKMRIDLLFGLLLFFGLSADLGRMIAEAGPRVRAEDEAMTRISRDFAAAALASLKESPDPEASLTQMFASLGPLRHVRIGFAKSGEATPVALPAPDPDRDRAPDWFARLIDVHPGIEALPAMVNGRLLGQIFIASDPTDEIDEIWAAASSLALTGGAVVLAALLGASLLLGRTLKPLDQYCAALKRLGDGDFSTRVDPAGSPEFVVIGEKINALGQALDDLSGANRRLIQKLMDVQDEERRAIAHELHDEIGPHLFALRANAAVLESGLRQQGAVKPADVARAIGAQVEALQGQNRRILRRLWPAALEDLGLAEALRILVQGFLDAQREVAIDLNLPDSFDPCGPREKLALYRLAQEALTNVFRHAGAKNVTVDLAFTAPNEVSARIRDDGAGFAPGAPPGLGLTGMRERMRRLGGRFAFQTAPEGGALIEALLPVAGR